MIITFHRNSKKWINVHMGILQSNLVDSYNKSMISFFEWDTRQQRPSFSLKNKKKDEHIIWQSKNTTKMNKCMTYVRLISEKGLWLFNMLNTWPDYFNWVLLLIVLFCKFLELFHKWCATLLFLLHFCKLAFSISWYKHVLKTIAISGIFIQSKAH